MQTADLARNGIVKKLETYERLFYGFSYVGDIVPSNYKHLPHAITIGQPLSPAIIDAIAAGPNDAYYAEYLSVNDRLDLITGQLEAEIEKLGYFAHAVLSSKRTDFVNISGEFPHKSAAVRAGLGWIGKSSLFITREYGPRIRLSTVLTDIPLPSSRLLSKNYCGKCRKCTDSCPANAISGNSWRSGLPREALLDAKRCDFWKINKYPEFHGQVCGICVAVCPHGK